MDTVDAFATLRLADDNLIPEVVTHIMRHKPEVAAKTGDPLYPNSQSKAKAKTGTWFVSTDFLKDMTPEQHLHEVYKMVEAHIVDLKSVYPTLDIRFSVLADHPSTISASLCEKVLSFGHLECVPLGED